MATNERDFYNIGEYNLDSGFGHKGVPSSSVIGTDGNDWFRIGSDAAGKFHHGVLAKDINKRINRGNIGSQTGQGPTLVDTGDGDDRIDTGLNHLLTYGKADPSATHDAGNIWQNATVKMGNGNDTLNVGKPHTDFEGFGWRGFGANIHGAKVYMGMGNDTISVWQNVDGRAVIYTDDPGDQGLPRSVNAQTTAREVVSPNNGGDDVLMVGGHVGAVGDLSNASPRIHMGGGNDKLRVAGKVWAHSLIDMGEGNNYARVGEVRMWGKMLFGNGNDTLNVDASLVENARVEMDDASSNKAGGVIELDENVIIVTPPSGSGNDTLNVGKDIHGNTFVNMGDGDNKVNVGGVIGYQAKVIMGNGNDSVHIKDGMIFESQLNTGGGNDKVVINNNIAGSAQVHTGDGNDVLSVGGDITNGAKVYMGNGDDTFTANKLINNAEVHMGEGNNTATVKAIDHYAKMFFGNGNDQLTITDSFGVGAVQDRAALKNTGAQVYMGAGDDVVTYGGKTLTGVIHGGTGKDTFVLTYDADDSLVSGLSAIKNVTNLSTLNIKGFEVIRMEGKNVVDVKYTDLLHDDSRDGPLYIQGNNSSKVDLGSTNWSSDGADKGRLKENAPGDPLDIARQGSWSKSGSAEVDGVQYDIYHHSQATDTSNDVYIQQGVVVI